MASFEFGVHYSCQSLDGGSGPLYRDVVEQARFAETLGFSGFSVAEHHFFEDGWVPQPSVLLGAIAGATDRARLATNVTLLVLHDPIEIAEQAAVLDLLSDGNFSLGVSIGWIDAEFDAFGVEKRTRAPRLEEAVELVRRLLTERSVTHDGEFYSVEDVTVTPRPQGDVPLWIGGMAEPGLRRAARIGDAWSVSPFESPSELAEKVAVYRDALSDAGRSYDDVHVPLRREAYVAEDDDTAWGEVGEALLYEHGEVYGDIGDASVDLDELEGAAAVEAFREHAGDRFLVGGPDTVIDQLERYHEAAEMDEVLVRTHFPGLDMDLAGKSLERIAADVMPHFE